MTLVTFQKYYLKPWDSSFFPAVLAMAKLTIANVNDIGSQWTTMPPVETVDLVGRLSGQILVCAIRSPSALPIWNVGSWLNLILACRSKEQVRGRVRGQSLVSTKLFQHALNRSILLGMQQETGYQKVELWLIIIDLAQLIYLLRILPWLSRNFNHW